MIGAGFCVRFGELSVQLRMTSLSFVSCKRNVAQIRINPWISTGILTMQSREETEQAEQQEQVIRSAEEQEQGRLVQGQQGVGEMIGPSIRVRSLPVAQPRTF